MRPLASKLVVLAAALAACGRQDPADHERYVEARSAVARVTAAGDPRCGEEPTCSAALAALAAIGPDSPDHGGAGEVLARVDAARRAPPPPPPEPLVLSVTEPEREPEPVVAPAPLTHRPPERRPEAQAIVLGGPRARSAQSRSTARPDEGDDERDEPARARPATGDPGRGPFSCASIRWEIERRKLRRVPIRPGIARVQVGYAHCPENQPKSQPSLDDLESDGTTPAHEDEHPEIPHYERLLDGCTETPGRPPPPPPCGG